MQKSIELVIFDLDGVLVDSELLSAEMIIAMAKESGIVIDLLYVRRNFIGKNFQTVMSTIETTFQVSLPTDFERIYLDRLALSFASHLKATAGIESILKNLKTKSCIATSSPPERAMNSLRVCGLADFFRDVVFTSSMVERAKPAPDLFLLAAQKMGVSPENCLVIEDSVVGLQAGLAAGMIASRYIGGGHLRGRNPVRSPPKGLDKTFDNWADFPSLYPSIFAEDGSHGHCTKPV